MYSGVRCNISSLTFIGQDHKVKDCVSICNCCLQMHVNINACLFSEKVKLSAGNNIEETISKESCIKLFLCNCNCVCNCLLRDCRPLHFGHGHQLPLCGRSCTLLYSSVLYCISSVLRSAALYCTDEP